MTNVMEKLKEWVKHFTIVLEGNGYGLVHDFECGCMLGSHKDGGLYFIKCMNHWHNDRRAIRLGEY